MNPVSNIRTLYNNANYRLTGNNQYTDERLSAATTVQGRQVGGLKDFNLAQERIIGLGIYSESPVRKEKKSVPLISPLGKSKDYLEEDFSQSRKRKVSIFI